MILTATNQSEIETEFIKLVEQRAGALLVVDESLFSSIARTQLIELAARYAVPTLYQYHQFVIEGGLMSYGTNLADAYRRAGAYVGRVLKDEKPADLPVQRSTKVSLPVPPSLLARADEVIE